MNPTAEEVLAEEPVAASTEEIELDLPAVVEAPPDVEIEVVPDAEPVTVEKPFNEEGSAERIKKDEEELKNAPRSVQDRFNTLTYHKRALEKQRDELHKDIEEHAKYAIGVRTAAESLAKENAELKQVLKDIGLREREARLALAQREHQTAREANDYARESESSRLLATLESEKAQISAYIPPAAWVPPQPPVRQYQAENKLSDETNSWLARNSWFSRPSSPVEAAAKTLAVSLSDQLAEQGVAPTSEIHYSRIDDELRRRFPDRFANTGAPMTTEPAKTQPAASPARRPPVATATRTNNGAGNGTRTVVMTASQAAKAKAEAAMFGVSVTDYLKYKHLGEK